MKTELQRIAIAEACGWYTYTDADGDTRWHNRNTGADDDESPDYCNDLNAIRSAIEQLVTTKVDQSRYSEEITQAINDHTKDEFRFIGATGYHIAVALPSLHCKALIKTIGKWQPEEGAGV